METMHMEANLADFRSYIDQKMVLPGDASYREEVTAQLLDRAKGNFLWVHLAVQEINIRHTKPDVESSLMELPSGMEALYNRMATSVESHQHHANQRLGRDILSWATCAQRLLSVEELGDALDSGGVLDIHRTIGDLCGGFVVVDQEGRITLIHETAREYLTRGEEQGRSLFIDCKPANDLLFKRCMARLMDPSLKRQVSRNRPPVLLSYAVSAWPDHLALGSSTDPAILGIVLDFLKSPHVLTWIHVAAGGKELRTLVIASRHLSDLALDLRRLGDGESAMHHQAAAIIEGWATDLIKVVGKFGNNLLEHPSSIYKLIPPFCPEDSQMYQQFGKKESQTLRVSGHSTGAWDDRLARFSLSQGEMACGVLAAGNRIAVLAVGGNTSQVIVYNATTFEEQRRLTHPERVSSIRANKLGDLLVSYGYRTTRVWRMATGECIKSVHNPEDLPRPHSILFAEDRNMVLVCGEDRCIRSVPLDQNAQAVWAVHCRINEQPLANNFVTLPYCSALSPDGNMIAFGYRAHPATVWELEPPMLLGQCSLRLDRISDRTVHDRIWTNEVFSVAWHPYSGEVFGLTQVGLLFRWNPYDEEASAKVLTGANTMAINTDGSLIATGNAVGAIRIYAAADFSFLYQLASQDSVFHISFSSDSRRLYDIRGPYGNVWEPNALIRLAAFPDRSSASHGETDSLGKTSLRTEHVTHRADIVCALSGQSVGPLYCYGTEASIAYMCEVGRGNVWELARLTSYMPVEHVAWSKDGRLVALADLCGRLVVKSIAKVNDNKAGWRATTELDMAVIRGGGHISQVFFHPAGGKLFASTLTAIFSIDLASRALTQSTLKKEMPMVKWAWHPTTADTILGFGNTTVYVFSWTDLQELEAHSYFPPRLGRSATVFPPSFYQLKDNTETLGRLISSLDNPQVLLETTLWSLSNRIEKQYLLFDMTDLRLGSHDGRADPNDKVLSYTAIPREIALRIREPLGFIAHGRLVFLDVNRWVCTWRLPSSVPAQPWAGKASELDAMTIELHYFLPGDWVTSREARLCTVTPDGKLLCPRNDEVVVVQAATLQSGTYSGPVGLCVNSSGGGSSHD